MKAIIVLFPPPTHTQYQQYLIWKNIYETNQFLDKTTPTESTANIFMYINKPQTKTKINKNLRKTKKNHYQFVNFFQIYFERTG